MMLQGMGVSLGLGALVVWLFWVLFGRLSGLSFKEDLSRTISNLVTGTVERAFFTLAVAYDFGEPISAMVGWLAIKLAANWNHESQSGRDKLIRKRAFRAALTGIVSMLFALIGGQIAKGDPWWW